MTNKASGQASTPTLVVIAAVGLATLVVVASMGLAPRRAAATPQFTQQTKLGCTACHEKASGGTLTARGKKFQANGNKL